MWHTNITNDYLIWVVLYWRASGYYAFQFFTSITFSFSYFVELYKHNYEQSFLWMRNRLKL